MVAMVYAKIELKRKVD
jgi:hypothetical protein